MSSLVFKKYFYVCEYYLHVCKYTHVMTQGGQKRVSDLLRLELQMVFSSHVSAGY